MVWPCIPEGMLYVDESYPEAEDNDDNDGLRWITDSKGFRKSMAGRVGETGRDGETG